MGLKHDGNDAEGREPYIITREDVQMMVLFSNGLSEAKVADRLHRKPTYVHSHIQYMLDELDCPSKLVLFRKLQELGLLKLKESIHNHYLVVVTEHLPCSYLPHVL